MAVFWLKDNLAGILLSAGGQSYSARPETLKHITRTIDFSTLNDDFFGIDKQKDSSHFI